jgi:hypothetical protein
MEFPMSLCSSLLSSLNGTVGRVLSTATALVALFASQAEAQVVISQVYGAGGNGGATYNRDFVELYNTTSAPVSLSSWSVQYASTTGSTWTVTALGGTIPANGYFLVGMSSGANGAALPTVDLNGSQAMAATAGKVALSSSTTALTGACPTGGTVVDFVGYGSGTNCFEGAGPTASLGATSAALRGNFGCSDTNNNSADFTATTPTPRNSTNTNGSATVWYLDGDNDGYGLTSSSVQSCTAPSGYVANGGDCDDGNVGINPGALDICNTGIDEDCDGTVDNPPVAPVFNVTQNTYHCTIQGAINAANPGDVLDIGVGTFNENVIVNKSLSLVGNSGFPSTRPVIVGTGAQVILVSATNVTLENLQVDFDGTGATSGSPKSGIVAPTPATYDGLLVKDCLIRSTATTGVSIFNSFGIQLASLSATGTAGVTLTGNTVTHSGTSPLGRGVRTWYTHGTWSGNTASGVYSFQVGDVTGGLLHLDNNTLDGVTEINSTAFAGTHTFSGNLCGPSNANGPGSEYALLELKNLQFAGVTLDITGNTFANFTNFGLFSGRSQNLNVANNVFTPAAGATGFRSARFDTKQRTNAAAPYAALALTGISVTGNTFNGNVALGQAGIALELANSDSVSSFATGGVSVTGNTFAADNAAFLSLNASTGSTSGDPVWAGLSVASNTTRAPVSLDLAALGNSFDAGSGVTLASAMTNAELFVVEDKVQHKVDNSALGLVHVKAIELFVTQASGSIQRGIDASVAGETVHVGAGTFAEALTVAKDITLSGTNALSGDPATLLSLGAGQTGVSVATSGVTLENLAAVQATNGVRFANGLQPTASVTNLTLNNFDVDGGTIGFRMGTAIGLDGLTITGSAFDNNIQGWFVAIDGAGASTLKNVLVTDTTFNGNTQKGIYVEKLENATFDGITVQSSGVDAAYGFNNGIDINLKYRAYSNITIRNSEVFGCGAYGTASNPLFPAAVAVKARDDSPAYNTLPASLTGLLIENCYIDGPESALRLGEPAKNNAGPSGVTIEECALSGGNLATNTGYGLINSSVAVPTAITNWWGSAAGHVIAQRVSGSASYSPWLTSGVDTSAAIGFQPNLPATGTQVNVSLSVLATVICPGGADGALDSSVSGGTGPYTYLWSNGATTSSVSGLIAGNYSVVVTDVNGSEGTANVTLLDGTDTTDPVITTFASNGSAFADGSCQAALPDFASQIVATDNCTGVSVTQLPLAGTPVTVGVTNVTITVADGNGNDVQQFVTFTVTDNTPPVIASCAPGQSVSAGPACTGLVPDFTAFVTASDNCNTITVTQSPAAGTSVPLGITAISLTVTDGAGNTAGCASSLNVVDTTAPTLLACAPAASAFASASCTAVLPDLTGGVSATDNCSSVTVVQSPAPGSTAVLGANVVSFVITDAAGNSTPCATTFTVIDNTPPTISSCAPAQQGSANTNCLGLVPDFTAAVVAADNCSVASITQSPAAGSLVPLGINAVTITVTDGSGNTANCASTFTVNDTTPPVIASCAPPVSLNVNAFCAAALPNLTGLASISDNCSSVTVTQFPPAGVPLAVGNYTVVLTATDAAGNSNQCSTVVTVIDNIAPTISVCAPGQSANADASCNAIVPNFTGGVVASDNCAVASITQSPAAGSLAPLGVNVITISVKDAGNNEAICTTTFTVNDVTLPVVTTCAPDQTVAAGAGCTALVPDFTGNVVATDNCSVASITQVPAVGSVAAFGATLVTLTVTDGSGNTAQCTATLNVADQTAPSITFCPAAAQAEALAGCTANVPDFTASLIATDNCSMSLTVTQSPLAGSPAALGATPVLLTVTDAAGNFSTCGTTFTVVDTTAPLFAVCPPAQTLNADSNCEAALGNLVALATATDNCPVTVVQAPVAGTLLPIGPTVVTLTATDSTGNVATCLVTATVVDTTAPVITDCGLPVTVSANGTCFGTIPDLTGSVAVTDNCTATGALTRIQVPAANTTAGVGATPVQITITDAAGNSTQCTVVVTVVDDTDPTISCPGSSAVTVAGSCSGVLGDLTGLATAGDNCGTVTVTQSPLATDVVLVGPLSVTLTATDVSGNTASCIVSVTVSGTGTPVVTYANAAWTGTLPGVDPDGAGPATSYGCDAFATVQAALNAVAVGGDVHVAAGTYNENVSIAKTLNLHGNGGAPAVRPLIVGTGAQTILVSASSVEIENLHVQFDGTGATGGSPKSGLYAADPNTFNGLVVEDSVFESTANTGVSIFNSFGIQLGSPSASGSALVTLTNNTTTHAGTSPLGRGVRTWFSHGTWTGNTASGVYSFQVATPVGGELHLDNNTLFGVAEINSITFVGSHSFDGNVCDVSNANGPGSEFALLELKNLELAGPTLSVSGNTFNGFVNFGVFSGRSGNVALANNVFTPAAGATGFRSVRFDTKQRTNGTAPYPAVALAGISVTGNTFNGNVALGQAGIALELANSDSVSSFATGGVSVTGNTFAADNAAFLSLNASTGSTSGDPVWAGLSVASNTTRAPVSLDLAALGNSFDAGSGVTLASAMTNAELFVVEDKVQHEVDNTALGLVHVKAIELFVTQASGSIQRGIDASVAGETVHVGAGTFAEALTVAKDITLSGTNALSGDPATLLSLGAGQTGVSVATSGVTLENLAAVQATNGVRFANGLQPTASVTNLALNNVHVDGGTIGYRMGTAIGLDGLTITGSAFDNNIQGWFVAIDGAGASTLKNVLVSDTTFNGNTQKGIYVEKLENATFDGITVQSSGVDAAYGFNNGIDINLKYRAYSNITIRNSEVFGCGAYGTASNPLFPAAVAIKARDDSPAYNTLPASLTGLLIENCYIDGPESALRLGEPTKNNAGPSGVTVEECALSGGNLATNTGYGLINSSVAVPTAITNWWGTAAGHVIAQRISGSASYTPWLTTGVDTSAAIGFQPVLPATGTPLNVALSVTANVTCPGGADGSIDATVSGGTGPFTYSWSNGAVSEDVFGLLAGPYSLLVTDANGTQASANTTVLDGIDSIAPTFVTCAPPVSVSVNAFCAALAPDLTGSATVTDNCFGTITVTQSPAPNTPVFIGNYTVTLTATDPSGNSSQCTTTISVVDTTPPVITSCAPNQSAAANASCAALVPNFLAGVVTTDNCGPGGLSYSQSPLAGTSVTTGVHPVTITVTDTGGNSSQCVATFTVTDTTPPVITACAPNQTVPAGASCTALVPDFAANVSASDTCTPSLTVTQSPAAGSVAALGNTLVTITVTDASGNSVQCNATLTVNDTTPPAITSCGPRAVGLGRCELHRARARLHRGRARQRQLLAVADGRAVAGRRHLGRPGRDERHAHGHRRRGQLDAVLEHLHGERHDRADDRDLRERHDARGHDRLCGARPRLHGCDHGQRQLLAVAHDHAVAGRRHERGPGPDGGDGLGRRRGQQRRDLPRQPDGFRHDQPLDHDLRPGAERERGRDVRGDAGGPDGAGRHERCLPGDGHAVPHRGLPAVARCDDRDLHGHGQLGQLRDLHRDGHGR